VIELRLELTHPSHRALADALWVAKLRDFVAERIRTLGRFTSENGAGTVRSRYGEDRFMGPLSAVKHRFEVGVAVPRKEADTADRYEITVDYDPGTGTFSCVTERVDTLPDREREARRRDVEKVLAALCDGGSEEDFRRLTCPECGSPLQAEFYPQGSTWTYACAKSPAHFASLWQHARLDAYGWLGAHLADRRCPRCHSEADVVGIDSALRLHADPLDRQAFVQAAGFPGPETWLCRRCEWAFGRGSPGRTWP